MNEVAVISRAEARASGLIRYFTGVPCRNDHIAERTVGSGRCIECGALNMARWRGRNQAIVKQLDRLDRATRKQTEAYKVKARQRTLAWRQSNPDKVKEHNKNWRKYVNLEKSRENYRKWARNHKDKVRQKRARRVARLRLTRGHLKYYIREIIVSQKWKCAICGCKLGKYHVDHIMPLALGGDDEKRNLQLLCPECNHSKSSIHPIDYMQRLGRLL